MSNTGPEPGFPPPPPPPMSGTGFGAVPPPPPVRRLVRDPHTKLGGVCSGLSQHFGIDVSVIRLGFVLFTVVTGLGLILYPLAWIIIPRAQVWPPTPDAQARSFSSRELALGAVLVGLALLVFVSGGATGEVIIPLVLIGGGIWLLTQHNQAGAPAPAAQPLTDTPGYQSATRYQPDIEEPWAEPDWSGPTSYALGTPPPPQQQRRRRPLRAIFIAIIAIIGGFFALIAGLIIAALTFGNVDFDFGETQTVRPLAVADIPAEIRDGDGELIIDLSELDASMFENLEEPIEMDVDRDVGEVRVVIPDDLVVDVDAVAGLGDVTVFDENADGINPRVTAPASEPDIELDINLGLGAVTVERP